MQTHVEQCAHPNTDTPPNRTLTHIQQGPVHELIPRGHSMCLCTPLELGRVEERQPSAGGGSTLCTHIQQGPGAWADSLWHSMCLRNPLELGRVKERQYSAGGSSTLCTHRKDQRSGRSTGAQEPCGEAAAAPSSWPASVYNNWWGSGIWLSESE